MVPAPPPSPLFPYTTLFRSSTVTIVTSPSTVVTKTVAGTLGDLTPGQALVVTGSQNADGTYTATRIVIGGRSEEHTSELQSRFDLVCRLLLEKKKTQDSDPQ